MRPGGSPNEVGLDGLGVVLAQLTGELGHRLEADRGGDLRVVGDLVDEHRRVHAVRVHAGQVAVEVRDVLADDLGRGLVVQRGEVEHGLAVVGVDHEAVAVDVRQTAHVAVADVDLLGLRKVAAVVLLEPRVEARPVDHLDVLALVGREQEAEQAVARAGDGGGVDVGEAGVVAGLADPGVLLSTDVGVGRVEGRGLLVLDLIRHGQEGGALRQILVAGDGVEAVAALDGADAGVLALQAGLDGAVFVDVLEPHLDRAVVRQAREGEAVDLGLVDQRDDLDLVQLAVEPEVGDRGGAENPEDEAELAGFGGDDDDLLGLVHVVSLPVWTFERHLEGIPGPPFG